VYEKMFVNKKKVYEKMLTNTLISLFKKPN